MFLVANRILLALLASLVFSAAALPAAETKPPLRVAIAGLVHGHADGFFSNSLHRADIQIVAIGEPDRALFDRYAAKFHLDSLSSLETNLIVTEILDAARRSASSGKTVVLAPAQ
jgi:hypothetical protein